MSLHHLGFTLHVIGELVIAYAVIRMHAHVSREHRIDKIVISSIKQEKGITLFGMLLIILGYALQIPFK